MDRGASGKPNGVVGQLAVDLIGRIFGGGRRRKSRRKSGKSLCSSLCGLDGYSRLQETKSINHVNSGCANLPSVGISEGRSDFADDELSELRQLRPRSSSFSSADDSSRRWTSSTDQYSHRRRKGFYCMRLRIVSMMRLVAMIRKVRLAYRRMMGAAAASKTILSLADLYNDIADLIPVSCSGSTSEARTIVVIRPIKCAPGPTNDAEVEETPRAILGNGFRATSSTTSGGRKACQPEAGHGGMLLPEAVGAVADHIPSSSWLKYAFPGFGCVCTSNVSSWTVPQLKSQDHL